jgi:hypothetical protein
MNKFTLTISALLLTAAALLGFVQVTYGNAIIKQEATPVDRYELNSMFASSTNSAVKYVTASFTSTSVTPYFDADGRYVDGTIDLRGAEKATFYFSRGDTSGQGNTGQSVFSVEVTPDGTNWYTFSKLVGSDISATATSSVTIGAATSTVQASMNLTHDTFKAARCKVVETTDGEHTCVASVEY